MKFIKTFFFTSISLFILLYGFILAIDPYDKFGFNPFKMKTKAVAMARENKFNVFEHTQKNYEAFIIGSSAAHRIRTNIIKDLTGYETYNYALQHTTPEDYLAIFNHIRSKTTPKLILLQMDFTDLDKNFKADTRFYISPLYSYLQGKKEKEKNKNIIDTDYLTLEALRDSVKVIWVNALDKARHIYVDDGNYAEEPIPTNPIKVNQFHDSDYQIDLDRVAYLKTIKETCQREGIKLIVFSAPVSWAHYQRILASPKMTLSMEIYKKEVKNIFGEFYDFMNESVKNYNTTEYFNDSTHPSVTYSKMMIEQIFNKKTQKDPQFGKIY